MSVTLYLSGTIKYEIIIYVVMYMHGKQNNLSAKRWHDQAKQLYQCLTLIITCSLPTIHLSLPAYFNELLIICQQWQQ